MIYMRFLKINKNTFGSIFVIIRSIFVIIHSCILRNVIFGIYIIQIVIVGQKIVLLGQK